MKITTAIFARNENNKLADLLYCLKNQTIKTDIFVYIDKLCKKQKNFVETAGLNLSQKRNLAIQNCKTDFLLMVDDDNFVETDFLEKLLNYYNKIKKVYKNDFIISPIVYWRKTDKIQSAGVKFNYFLSKISSVNKHNLNKLFWEIPLIGGNCLFGKIATFKKTYFDEKIGFIREDLDYIASLKENKVKVFIVNIPIYHLERDKTFLEKSFIGNWKSLKRKIRNRNIFVKKHGKIHQKFLFFLFGYWFQPLYYIILFVAFNIFHPKK